MPGGEEAILADLGWLGIGWEEGPIHQSERAARHAEAAALAHLVTAGGQRIIAAVVVGEAAQPVTPCGGCRQKLREFAADDCPVWSANGQAFTARFTLGELLPASFGPDHLKA